MLGILLVAFAIGAVIRFNITHAEPLLADVGIPTSLNRYNTCQISPWDLLILFQLLSMFACWRLLCCVLAVIVMR